MYKDVHNYYKSCDACQRIRRLAIQSLAKLVTSFPKKPFMKLGLDFVGQGQLSQQETIQGTNIFLLAHIVLLSGRK
jgi:hypothetical protein